MAMTFEEFTKKWEWVFMEAGISRACATSDLKQMWRDAHLGACPDDCTWEDEEEDA